MVNLLAGFVNEKNPSYVWCLNKEIYGLKKAPYLVRQVQLIPDRVWIMLLKV